MGRRYLVGVLAFQYFMKLLLLLLLPLISYLPASKPAPVRVTFSPLTKAAYLAARKACVSTKPQFTFPLKKQKGRIVIPTVKGPKIFQDKGRDEDDAEQERFQYLGYQPLSRCHLLKIIYYESAEYLLIDAAGKQLSLCGEPLFSPDMRHIAASSMGIEYGGGQPNMIQLLELRGGSVRQVWYLEPKTWEPHRICWTSSSTMYLMQEQCERDGHYSPSRFTYKKLVIE